MSADTESKKDELIMRLRQELELSESDVSDDDLLKKTEGTFVFSRIKLAISLLRLFKDVKAVFRFNKGE